MYREIVVPLDGSALAEQAVPFAITLAQRSGAILRLLHVHVAIMAPAALTKGSAAFAPPPSELDFDARTREQQYLDRLAERVRELRPDTRIAVEVLDGRVVDTLLDKSKGADLVILATHGRGAFGRGWLGSVADRFVRESAAPSILIRPGEEPADLQSGVTMERILVCLDGSTASEAVLEPAIALATLLGVGITLLRVFTLPVGVRGAGAPMGVYLESPGPDPEQSNRQLEELADRVRTHVADVKALTSTHPRVVDGIHTASAEGGVGLIALATRGHGGMKRLLLGSVADKIIRTADVPVLVVAAP